MVILRNKANDNVFKHIDGMKFENVTMRNCGVLSKEVAESELIINAPLTKMCMEYPAVLDLIGKMRMVYDSETTKK